jgi:hypothetical protein
MKTKYENAIKANEQPRNAGDKQTKRASFTLFNLSNDS